MMKKEKNIYERQAKSKGKYLQVKIRFKDSSTGNFATKEFGRFYLCDFRTPGEAMKAAVKCRNMAKDEIENGLATSVNFKKYTVGECYEQTQKLLLRSLRTKETHDAIYRQLISDKIASTPIMDIRPIDIQISLNEFAMTHSAGGVNDAWTIWKQIYQAGGLIGIPLVDIMARVTKPKSKIPIEHRSTECTIKDVNLLLAALAKYGHGRPVTRHRCRCLDFAFRIMLYEALRPQEVFALSREDIDLKNMTMYVRKSVGSNETERRQIIPTKTDESTAEIPIADAIKPVLEELLEWSSSDPLLADYDGLPMETDVLNNLLIAVRGKFKLPRVTMYMARHLAATQMYNATSNKKDVQNNMRHKSESTTQYYVNRNKDAQRRIINSISYE